jgi:hypothetical protein
MCPHCGHVVDRAGTAPFTEVILPKEGDILVCIRCAGIAFIGHDGRGHVPSAAELDTWRKSDPAAYAELLRYQRAIADSD